MATTIDNLQIEVQSNSVNAANGLKGLANALEQLEKKSSGVKAAADNLKELSGALQSFTKVGTAAGTVGTLARNLEKIKDVGKIASGVKRLSPALSSLNGITVSDSTVANLGTLSTALSKFNGTRIGGIGTAVNGIIKLNEATRALDAAKIEEFGRRVEKLVEVLTPLSKTMEPIANGFTRMGRAIKQTVVNVEQADAKVNVFALNLNNIIGVAHAVAGALQRVAQVMGNIMDEAIQWDGVSERFGRTFGEQAEETYAWVVRLNEEMGINVQQFMQSSSLYAQMLTGFGVAADDARKMALGYTELSYDIWASTNDRYKTLEEAQNAVASAIAGEVEPIRRAGFSITEAMLQETAAAHGLSGSLQEMTESQKSYLRYLTLIEQADATGTVGVYASELGTAEGLMRTFSQQLKSLAQAFGSLFLPALVAVMPYVQAFVELLTDAVRAVAGFFGVKIQAVDWSKYGSGAGGAAEATDGFADSANNAAKAAKELKNATIGIDELNVISPPQQNAGAAGAGGAGAGWDGMDVDSLWNESIFDNIQSKVDSLKEKIKGLWPVAAGIATALGGWNLMRLLGDIDDADTKLGKFKGTLAGVAKGLVIGGISIAVGKLTWDFTGAYLESGNLKDLGKMLGTTVLGAAVAGWLTGPLGAGLVILTSGVVALTRLGIELREGSVEVTDPQAFATAIVGTLETLLGGALVIDTLRGGKWTKAIGGAITDGLKKAWTGIKTSSLVTGLTGKLTTALSGIGASLAAVPGWAIAAAAAVVGTIALAIVDYDFTEIGRKVGEMLGSAVKMGAGLWSSFSDWVSDLASGFWNGINDLALRLDEMGIKGIIVFLFADIPDMIIGGLIDGLGAGIENLVNNVKEFCAGFVQGFKDALGIASPSTVFIEIGVFLVEGLWQGIAEMYGTLTENLSVWVSNMITKVKEFFGIKGNGPASQTDSVGKSVSSGLWSGVSSKVSELYTNFSGWVSNIIKKVKDYLGIGKSESEFLKIGKEIVNGMIAGIQGKASDLWGFLKGWVGGIVDKVKGFFGIHSPSTEFIEIAQYCVDGLKKPFTSDVLLQPIKNVWNGAKTWWNEKKGSLSTYTPSIGNITSKVSGAWSAAKTWWGKKGNLSTYTPPIGSISSKVSSAWSAAKTWWGKKGNLSTYTPKIGSITNALSSAWSAAKKWWDKNVKLSIPSLSLKVTYSKASGLKAAVVKALGLSGWPSLKFAANGGMFDMGSLIWAGERGAEIVANAHGGQTGVMNVEQMQEAVYNGVYAAVIAVQRAAGSGGEQAVNVYLDGKQISSAIDRRKKEQGKALMGTQVYSY